MRVFSINKMCLSISAITVLLLFVDRSEIHNRNGDSYVVTLLFLIQIVVQSCFLFSTLFFTVFMR